MFWPHFPHFDEEKRKAKSRKFFCRYVFLWQFLSQTVVLYQVTCAALFWQFFRSERNIIEGLSSSRFSFERSRPPLPFKEKKTLSYVKRIGIKEKARCSRWICLLLPKIGFYSRTSGMGSFCTFFSWREKNKTLFSDYLLPRFSPFLRNNLPSYSFNLLFWQLVIL